MIQVNIFQAKNELSKLIVSLENKEHDQIIIARAGHPVAELSLYNPRKKELKLGKFNGKYKIPDDIDGCNEDVLAIMGGAK